MKKILAITTIRSDYNLVRDLYFRLHQDPDIDFKVLVSGAHLSKSYGYSVSQIESDGFHILARLETLIDSDSKVSRLKTGSLLLQGAVDIVAGFAPDLILYAGDREDVIVGGLLGSYLEIPTVHIFGGDHIKDGYVDNPIRHATSKLSTVHIVSTERHKQRLIKMGEPQSRIFQTGSIALDRFVDFKPMTIEKIREHFDIKSGFEQFALLIFHPVSEEAGRSHLIFKDLLDLLVERKIYTFVSSPNTDPGNKDIIELMKSYARTPYLHFYKNLESELFLSVFKNCQFIIGNSSAGILEAASIPVPAISIGSRQIGRDAGANVLASAIEKPAIAAAIDKAMSQAFLESIKSLKNLYGDGQSCERAYQVIKKTNFKSMLYKKEDPLEI